MKNNNKYSKNDCPLVSIVVPVFNAEKYINTTINTVLNQTYTNWELILVNDCSTDKSLEIISHRKDSRIQIYSLSTNSGAAIARNYGISKANGKYICFLDADDLWENKKLEIQVKFMETNLNCAFSFTGYEFADNNGIPNGKKVFVPKKISYKEALKNTTICTITVMFNMNLLSKEDIYMPNVLSEDTATWWKVLKKIDFAYGINKILSFYRRGIKTKSSNKLKAIKQTWFLYRKVEKLSILQSIYYFTFYIFNAILRRI